GGSDYLFRFLHRFGDGLFQEDMAAGGESLFRISGMGIRPGIDRDGIGLRHREGCRVILIERHTGKFRGDIGPALYLAAAEASDLETLDRLIGSGMADAHIAEPHYEN